MGGYVWGPSSDGSYLMYLFRAVKSGDQATTSSFADLTGWATPEFEEDPFSFNTTTGVLTFQEDGVYEFDAYFGGTQTGNSRVQFDIKFVEDVGAGFVDFDCNQFENYIQRNNTQNDGGFFAHGLRSFSEGDQLKIQVRTVGTAFTGGSGDGFFEVKKIR